MRISDWSSDVCSSDLPLHARGPGTDRQELLSPAQRRRGRQICRHLPEARSGDDQGFRRLAAGADDLFRGRRGVRSHLLRHQTRSEEHTSELQSLMRISYAVFCLKKKTTIIYTDSNIKQQIKNIQKLNDYIKQEHNTRNNNT